MTLRSICSDLNQAGTSVSNRYNGRPDAKPVKTQISIRRENSWRHTLIRGSSAESLAASCPRAETADEDPSRLTRDWLRSNTIADSSNRRDERGRRSRKTLTYNRET